ncbi:hypothetical protein YH63_010910 [Afipia massiliensis]|uniref:Endonuclease GajA/Old nuclease/RecF-like AAA domain-containing protein n=1 Tax=Afipia massiliensis TaxID=211460 RepID=A0A4U6BND1_9BRAD|nr:AAA family ATPase [Afipia massiliensis]TKT71886.1 hypothetical protein YH63_010910 [Afipia massiliensis]
MKLTDFRILNFRSIKDSGWCSFSADGTTVLIGQNESGKTSILAALEKSFNGINLEDDDVRAGEPLPRVIIRLITSFNELENSFSNSPKEQLDALEKYLTKTKGRLEFSKSWVRSTTNKDQRYEDIDSIEDPLLAEMLNKNWPASKPVPRKEKPEEEEEEKTSDEEGDDSGKIIQLTAELVANAVYTEAPLTVLFDEKTGLLPNSIDVVVKDGSYTLSGEGETAAENYLEIAGINLQELIDGDARARESILHRGNQKVTSDFTTFWSQTIGKKDRLLLKCDLRFYGQDASGKSGKPYLVFWISDGQNHLYPKQRSSGVRWFVSFYLQLKSSDEYSSGTLFLLDEPGANLHAKAQDDVLKLINRLSDKKQIMYSTHSAHMIEYDKLYRVLAVQREGDLDDTPTVIIHAHRIGGASRDTLSPVLTAMGADFSQQTVIKKHNNVILEEMSGFYYLKAFWKLLSEEKEAHFIAATGANNVESLANMFVGWGLDFIVAVDDDPTGRAVYNSIKRHMFADDESLAQSKLLKIGGKGIEDILDISDFKSIVLNDTTLSYKCENSQYVKDAQKSKTMLAYQFWIKVSDGTLKLKKLSPQSQEKITKLVEEISSRLL